MSTENAKASEAAWENIEICCTTLCDKDAVIKYIKQLEEENERLRQVIAYAARSKLL